MKRIELSIPRIVTGDINNVDEYNSKGYVCVSVAYRSPKFIHYEIRDLVPDRDTYLKYKSGELSRLDFCDAYRSQISDDKLLKSIILSLTCVAALENASGVVLVANGSHMESHRSVIADVLNASKLIEEKIVEL